jgi:hypothetical protein
LICGATEIQKPDHAAAYAHDEQWADDLRAVMETASLLRRGRLSLPQT